MSGEIRSEISFPVVPSSIDEELRSYLLRINEILQDSLTGKAFAVPTEATTITDQGALATLDAVDASDVQGVATAAQIALIKASLLANWRLDIADIAGRPAGIYPIESITNFDQVDWLDSGEAEIKILSTPDTTVAYGFPAIPIDDKQKYKIIIRHKSSAASADGLYLRFNQYSNSLPVSKTHIGSGGGTNTQTRTNFVDLVGNGVMPGTSWVVNEYTYTPTAGTKYASFSMYNFNPDTAEVEYHVDYVLMYVIPKTADEIPETGSKKWAGESGADITGDHPDDIIYYASDSSPPSHLVGRLWYDTTAGKLKRSTGSVWNIVGDETSQHQGDISLANLAEKSVDSLVDGTTYKKFLNTERTKLTGVETGADVTGSHQGDINIDNIAEGAAYKKYLAAERTKMTGMEAGADVTLTHVAATIISQGDLATLDEVNTAQIVDNAVTLPVSAYTAGSTGDQTGEYTVQQAVIESVGGLIFIHFSLEVDYAVDVDSGGTWNVKVYEGGNLLYTSPTFNPFSGAAVNKTFSYSLGNTPGSGSKTFYVKIAMASSDYFGALKRSLLLLETKK